MFVSALCRNSRVHHRIRSLFSVKMTRRAVKSSMATSKRPIDLSYGWPSPDLLPALHLDSAAHAVLSNPDIAKASLRYGPDEGYLPLREEIAKWLTEFYAPKDAIDTQRICITGGASQNLACVLQTFTDPIYTRNVWMVAPTYFLACRIMDDAGFAGRLKGVPEDAQGVDIDYLAEHIEKSEQNARDQGNDEPKLKSRYPWRKTYKHIIYGVPTFANPSGCLMSLHRRQQLVRLARKYDALIITDDVYDMLLWPAESSPKSKPLERATLPRIVDVDRTLDGGPTSEWGNAMSNGSFSKIVAPGCRTGWAEATPKLAWALSQCGPARSGGAPSHLVASMIYQMMASGRVNQHIHEVLLPAYEKRYRRMIQTVKADLLPLGVTLPQPNVDVAGGYFVWLTLPASLDAQTISKRVLEEESLTVLAGPQVRVQGDEDNEATLFKRNIRLSFTYVPFDELAEGVQRLAKIIKTSLEEQK